MWLAEELTGVRFTEVADENGTSAVLECEGIGFAAGLKGGV